MSEQREVIKVIGDIIKNQMSLRDDQIMLAYSKFEIPETPDIYIALSTISGKAIGNVSNFDPATNREIITTTMHELVQIDIMSFNAEARKRKEELVAILNSIYSEQQQEKYNFQIARIPGEFLNVASLEETKILNRFTITVAVTSLSIIERFPTYYDQFQTVEEHVNA